MNFNYEWFHFNNTTVHYNIIKSWSSIKSSKTKDIYEIDISIEHENNESDIYRTERLIYDLLIKDFNAKKIDEKTIKYIYDINNKEKYFINSIPLKNFNFLKGDVITRDRLILKYLLFFDSKMEYSIYFYFRNLIQFKLEFIKNTYK